MSLYRKLAALFVSVAVLPLSLFACSSDQSPAVTTDDPAADLIAVSKEFCIITPARDKIATKLARSLKSAVSKQAGLDLTSYSDQVTDYSPVTEQEILVGKTTRQESVDAYAALGENEWSVSVVNRKIVIAGNSVIALGDAIDHFISAYVTGKATISIPVDANHQSSSAVYSLDWAKGELIETGVAGGYPRMYSLQNGTLLLAHDGMYVYRSTDYGLTWEKPRMASQKEKGTANAALYQTEDGTVYLGYRSTYHNADGSFYSSIKVSYSTDDGMTWKTHSTVYENTEPGGNYNGVWEPHFGMMNGMLTCFYANDSRNVTDYQNIEYKQWDPATQQWINRTIVSNGNDHQSRDGMPVWQRLSTGEYVCVMEAWNKDDNNRFAIKLTYSEDGTTWSDPITVMRSTRVDGDCAAPYIIELPNGQIVVSCQTNELNQAEAELADNTLYMSTVISDGTPISMLTEKNFSAHSYPYTDNQPGNLKGYMWNGMYVYGYYLFTCSNGPNGIRLNRLDFTKE